MKKILVFSIVLLGFVLFVFADSQVQGTESIKGENKGMRDNSFVIQGYYKGTTTASPSVKLTITNKNGTSISVVAQDSSGSSISVSEDNYIQEGTPDKTIFKWILTGSGKNDTSLSFSFSVFQAELNGLYYKPAYTITMTKDPTYKLTNPNTNAHGTTAIDDSFSASSNQITELRVDASQNGFTGASTISYSGKITAGRTTFASSDSWYRSGYCSLNITSYEDKHPGAYRYVCWVVVEYTAT